MRPLLFLPVLALCLAACGTSSAQTEQEPTMAPSTSQIAAQSPDSFEVGDSVNITGIDGTPVKAILTGILYADAHSKDYEGDDQYAVAVAFTLVALGNTTKLGAPIDGRGFQWYSGDEQRTAMDATTPWEGCINAYNPHQDLIANRPTKVIVDLLLPAEGGTLMWNDETGPIQWTLPDEDRGHGTEPAAKYVTDYC